MRVTGSVPERVVEGDDSSENSSESGSLEVMDNNGEIIHRAKKLSCRVSESYMMNLTVSDLCNCVVNLKYKTM